MPSAVPLSSAAVGQTSQPTPEEIPARQPATAQKQVPQRALEKVPARQPATTQKQVSQRALEKAPAHKPATAQKSAPKSSSSSSYAVQAGPSKTSGFTKAEPAGDLWNNATFRQPAITPPVQCVLAK